MAQTCLITTGLPLGCNNNYGGIQALYFINRVDANLGFTLGADGSVTGFPQKGAPATNISAYKVALNTTTDSFNNTINANPDNATTYYTQSLSFTLKGLTQDVINYIVSISGGNPAVVIHTRGGQSYLVGIELGAVLNGGTLGVGGGAGDLVGGTVTMAANEKLPAPNLMGSTVTNPFAGVTNPPTVVTGVTP